MSKTTPGRLRVQADQKSCERLLAETLQRRRVALAIRVDLPADSTLNGTAAKYISEALAARIVSAELPAITPDDLLEAMQRCGVKREAAHDQVGLLQVERTVTRELPTDKHLADLVMAHVNGSPYISVNIATASAPPVEPAVEPVIPGPPRHENPSAVGRPPSMSAVDAAVDAREQADLEAIATGREES